MVKTIGNPMSWGAQAVGAVGGHLGDVIGGLHGEVSTAPPQVRQISTDDLKTALRKGFADFSALRSDVLFLVMLYPIIGLGLCWSAFHASLWPYLFPLTAGFALLGPVAAVGLYEMSRRREAGQPARWSDGFAFMTTPAIGPVAVLGFYLLAIFAAWMIAAHAIWSFTLGETAFPSLGAFLGSVFSTPAGWTLIVIGCAVGFVFAATVLAITVVSFPLIIDRHVSVPVAVVTSFAVARKNPVPVALWGLLVAVLLVLGSLPFLLGLVVVLPVLGHATWHLYRRAVV